MNSEISLKISKTNFYDFLYKIIIVLAIYDGIRHNSIFYSFSFFKELITLILLLAVLFENRFRVTNPLKYPTLSFFSFYILFIGTLVSIGNLDLLTRQTLNPLALHFKTLEFFLLIYLFSFYTFLTGKSIKSIALFFINVYVFYILFSIVSYFYHFPFITEFRPYNMRISSGYPTADGQSMSFALILLLFTKGETPKYVLKFLILSLGIIIQATTTGVATYVFICGIYFLFGKRLSGTKGHRKNWISIFYLFGTIFLLISLVAVYIDKDTLDGFYIMLTSKSEFIIYLIKLKVFGIEAETGHHLVTATYNVRGEAVDRVMFVYNEPLDLIFGRGTALASLVENQFAFTIRAYGYIGVLLYALFLIGLALLAKKFSRQTFWMVLILIGMLILTNASQITTYLYQIGVAFALAVNYSLTRSQTKIHNVPYRY